jgi:hypothetical protein
MAAFATCTACGRALCEDAEMPASNATYAGPAASGRSAYAHDPGADRRRKDDHMMFHRAKPSHSDEPSATQPAAPLPPGARPPASAPTTTPLSPSASAPAAPAPTGTLGYWQLTRGRLRSFEIPWSDTPDAFERLLRTLHGVKDFTLGVARDGLSVTVYRCRRPSSELSFQFLVTVGSGAQSDKILVEDLPDLLTFLDQLVPIIELAMKTRKREEELAARDASGPTARPANG